MSNENKVVLPEHWGVYVGGRIWIGKTPEHVLKLAEQEGMSPTLLYTEQQVRALLAGVSAPAAMAATEDERAAWFALAMNSAAYIEDAAACLRDGDAKRAATGAAKHVREKCNALWDSAPKAQAGARDALTPAQVEAGAKTIAGCMDYPWEHMPEQGRESMRECAKATITAIAAAKGGVRHER